MVVMVHPNGCVHTVKDEDLEVFTKAGWTIKAAPTEPPAPAATEKPKTKRKTAQK
jgi:hypothetical protein